MKLSNQKMSIQTKFEIQFFGEQWYNSMREKKNEEKEKLRIKLGDKIDQSINYIKEIKDESCDKQSAGDKTPRISGKLSPLTRLFNIPIHDSLIESHSTFPYFILSLLHFINLDTSIVNDKS